MMPHADYKEDFDKSIKRLVRAREAILKAATPGDLRSLELEARGAVLDARFRFFNLERWIREAVDIRYRELNDRVDSRAQGIIDNIKKQESEAGLKVKSAKKSVAEPPVSEDVEESSEDELPDVISDAVEEPKPKQRAASKKSSKKGA